MVVSEEPFLLLLAVRFILQKICQMPVIASVALELPSTLIIVRDIKLEMKQCLPSNTHKTNVICSSSNKSNG